MTQQFVIKKAVRKGTPALIGLWGPSGSGKTFTALHMARGLVGPAGKIGVIDTENRRAEFYADQAGGWDHLDLQPPFTPQRYTDAFAAFEDAGGYGCIIVDSMSHVWEGEGGVLDIADRSTAGGLKKWQAPKMAYKRMVNTLLRAPFHVIFCLRAKDAVRQVGKGRDAEIENVGLRPICDKHFIFELTVSALLGPDHKPAFPGGLLLCDPSVPAVKVPRDLQPHIQPGQHMGVETGAAIAEWISGGAAFDVDAAKLERISRYVATQGTLALRQHWEALSKPEQVALLPIKEELKALAEAADAEKAAERVAEEPPAEQQEVAL